MSTRAKFSRTLIPLLALFILALVGLTAGHETPAWREVPKPVFQGCVALTRHVLPDPVSGPEGDLILVTAYEETPEKAGPIRKSGTFLNVYLISGLFASPDDPEGILHDTHLIVVRWVYDARRATKTALQWEFSVRDPDYSLEKGIFQTTVLDSGGNVLSTDGVGIPEEALGEMQAYFDETVDRMADKAMKESADHWVTG